MVLAAAVFLASLVGLALLFALKALEAKHGSIYAAGLRSAADSKAIALKDQLIRFAAALSRIPPMLVLIGRYVLHELALAAAKLARLAEAQAHRVADLVSHKRSYEKRSDRPEPRSDFLKRVSEAKNGDEEETL